MCCSWLFGRTVASHAAIASTASSEFRRRKIPSRRVIRLNSRRRALSQFPRHRDLLEQQLREHSATAGQGHLDAVPPTCSAAASAASSSSAKAMRAPYGRIKIRQDISAMGLMGPTFAQSISRPCLIHGSPELNRRGPATPCDEKRVHSGNRRCSFVQAATRSI
jgi:hypothetical protein